MEFFFRFFTNLGFLNFDVKKNYLCMNLHEIGIFFCLFAYIIDQTIRKLKQQQRRTKKNNVVVVRLKKN